VRVQEGISPEIAARRVSERRGEERDDRRGRVAVRQERERANRVRASVLTCGVERARARLGQAGRRGEEVSWAAQWGLLCCGSGPSGGGGRAREGKEEEVGPGLVWRSWAKLGLGSGPAEEKRREGGRVGPLEEKGNWALLGCWVGFTSSFSSSISYFYF